MGDSLRDALGHVPSDHILDEFLGKHGVKVQPREFGALLGSLRVAMEAEAVADGALADRPANAQPVASRERVAEVLAAHNIECTGPGEVTCRGCRDKGWMSWSDYRQHVAALLAAGVFREPPTRAQIEAAVSAAWLDPQAGSGAVVDAVLALIGGDAK